MRVCLSLLALALAIAAIGCFSPTSTIQDSSDNGGNVGGCSTCTHHSIGGGSASGGVNSGGSSSAGSTGGAGSTSNGGSSGGGSTGGAVMCGASGGGGTGSNTIFDCDAVPFYGGDAGSCAPNDWLGTQVLDFETCLPICGATVQARGPDAIPIQGTAQLTDPATGTFHFCLPAGPPTTFETVVTGPDYGNFYYAEIQGQLKTNLPSFGMLTTEELQELSMFVQPELSFNEGALVAFIIDLDVCGGANPQAGWTITLTDEDGGAYPDGGYTAIYVDNTGFPEPGLTETEEYGVVIIYNIDPSIATFPTLHATNPNADGCVMANESLGFTGRIQVGPNIFSEGGIFLE